MGYIYGNPHRKQRKSCKWCPKRKHDNTRVGDTHRFHGVGSFCRTHHNHNNPDVAKYCIRYSGAHGRSGWGSRTQTPLQHYKATHRKEGYPERRPLKRVQFRKRGSGTKIYVPRRNLKTMRPTLRAQGYHEVK